MKTKYTPRTGMIAALALAASLFSGCNASAPGLEQRFLHPPAEARPWVYWFWMDGNVSREGITADLEAMHRAGVGGALMMGVGLGTPPGNVDFNSPLYREMYAHAAKECLRLGMQLSLHQCDGWATAGGPWITPDRSMKKLVWTVRDINGPATVPPQLEQPATIEDFYRDIAVLAVPLSAPAPLPPDSVTVNGKPETALTDGDPRSSLPGVTEVVARFDPPRPVASVTFHLGDNFYGMGRGAHRTVVEVSGQGDEFETVAEIDLHASLQGSVQQTLTASFAPRTARAVRLRLDKPAPGKINEIIFSSEPKVHLWEVKSSFARQREHGGETPWLDAAPWPPGLTGLDPSQTLNLTAKLAPDGKLDWTPPEGRWRILRIGMTSTGKHVAPRTNAGEGLEADKMSGEAIRFHFDSFAKGMIADNNTQPGNPIWSVHTDSWESNLHTWSSHFREEFTQRRGYDPAPWLPVLAGGMVVGDARESDRFLWDYRRTLADLIAGNFYGALRDKCHENGVLLQSEAAGRQMFLYDPLNYAAKTDMYVGEFWTMTNVRVDCKVAASTAHIYGRPVAGAEAFTSGQGGFNLDMFDVKALGDHAFCTGINRYIVHRYCMQPFNNVEPGLTFGPYGINFDRTNTWWENGAKAWCGYVGRCQSLLQTGTFIADVIHYIGDDAPNFLGHREDLWNPVPAGYDFDGCNLEILKQLSVEEGGVLALPSGMRYRVLLLPNREHMTLETAHEVERLVQAGATAIGPKPVRTPGLKDWQQNDATLAEITARVWGDVDGKAATENRCGRGRVIFGPSLESVLNAIAPPDFDFTAPEGAILRYIHRRADNADFYFVANGNKEAALDAVLRFRVTGKAPELWDASTGNIIKPAVYREVGGTTELPVHFDPAGSWFVVFREPASPKALVSLSRDGRTLFPADNVSTPPAEIEPAAADTFTLALWLRTDAGPDLPETAGQNIKPTGQNYAVYPAPGHEIWGGPDVGLGLSAGRGGLAVIGHGARFFKPLIVHPADLTDWTHVAVTANGGALTLYINGQPAAAAPAPDRPLHSPVGASHKRGVPPFNGQTAGLSQSARALDAAAVGDLMRRTRPEAASGTPPGIVFRNGQPTATGGTPGTYQAVDASGKTVPLTLPEPVTLTVRGPWTVTFPPGKQAPDRIDLPALISWAQHPDPGVKYFSGTATYACTFEISTLKSQIILDLGVVKNVAEVTLNGKSLGTLWKPPFHADITTALHKGSNRLEIKVTNLWPNRLIGDEKLHPDPELVHSKQHPPWAAGGPLESIPDWVKNGGKSPVGRTTFLLWRFYGGDEPLLDSGLLGPVTLHMQ